MSGLLQLQLQYFDTFAEGKSHYIKNFIVRIQKCKISCQKTQGLKVSKIHDLLDVYLDSSIKKDNLTTNSNVQVIGVPLLDCYKVCLQCKAHVEPFTPPLGKYTKSKCLMMQQYGVCGEQTVAKLLLMYPCC